MAEAKLPSVNEGGVRASVAPTQAVKSSSISSAALVNLGKMMNDHIRVTREIVNVLKQTLAFQKSIHAGPKTSGSAGEAAKPAGGGGSGGLVGMLFAIGAISKLFEVDKWVRLGADAGLIVGNLAAVKTIISSIGLLFVPFINVFKSIGTFFSRVAGVVSLFMPQSLISSVESVFASVGKIFSGVKSVFEPVGTFFSRFATFGTAVGRLLSRIAWPLTIIFGIIDGITGFVEEYGKSGDIVASIKAGLMKIAEGFFNTLVEFVGGAIQWLATLLGLDRVAAAVGDLTKKITTTFTELFSGAIDLITGIFKWDGELVLKGLGSIASGGLGLLATIVTAPLNLAINFIKDLFKWGEPDEPFDIMALLTGWIGSAWSWIKSKLPSFLGGGPAAPDTVTKPPAPPAPTPMEEGPLTLAEKAAQRRAEARAKYDAQRSGAAPGPVAVPAEPQGAAAPQQVPGAPGKMGAMPIGALSQKYESGRGGSSAVGYDSTGGTSYGKYQIASKTGTMNEFLKVLDSSNPEAAARLRSAGPQDAGKDGKFAQEWKKLAGEGALGGAESQFIKQTHYDPAMKKLTGAGLKDMVEGNKGLQEMMHSTAVQHGAGGASGIFNKVYKEGMSQEELVKAVYAERGTRFGSSTEQVRASVQKRFGTEQSDVLAMLQGGATGATGATSAPVAVAGAPAAPPPAVPADTGSKEGLLSMLKLSTQDNMFAGRSGPGMPEGGLFGKSPLSGRSFGDAYSTMTGRKIEDVDREAAAIYKQYQTGSDYMPSRQGQYQTVGRNIRDIMPGPGDTPEMGVTGIISGVAGGLPGAFSNMTGGLNNLIGRGMPGMMPGMTPDMAGIMNQAQAMMPDMSGMMNQAQAMAPGMINQFQSMIPRVQAMAPGMINQAQAAIGGLLSGPLAMPNIQIPPVPNIQVPPIPFPPANFSQMGDALNKGSAAIAAAKEDRAAESGGSFVSAPTNNNSSVTNVSNKTTVMSADPRSTEPSLLATISQGYTTVWG